MVVAGSSIASSSVESPSRVLKRLEAHFELAPPDKPRTVRLRDTRNG